MTTQTKSDIPKLALMAFNKVLENPSFYLELAAKHPALETLSPEKQLVCMSYVIAEDFVAVTAKYMEQQHEPS